MEESMGFDAHKFTCELCKAPYERLSKYPGTCPACGHRQGDPLPLLLEPPDREKFPIEAANEDIALFVGHVRTGAGNWRDPHGIVTERLAADYHSLSTSFTQLVDFLANKGYTLQFTVKLEAPVMFYRVKVTYPFKDGTNRVHTVTDEARSGRLARCLFYAMPTIMSFHRRHVEGEDR